MSYIVNGPEPERIQVLHFTEDYLSMHRVAPVIGRDVEREDCEAGAPLVALLGYGYWKSHYGGRREVLGETVRLETEVATIVVAAVAVTLAATGCLAALLPALRAAKSRPCPEPAGGMSQVRLRHMDLDRSLKAHYGTLRHWSPDTRRRGLKAAEKKVAA